MVNCEKLTSALTRNKNISVLYIWSNQRNIGRKMKTMFENVKNGQNTPILYLWRHNLRCEKARNSQN